jgi:hypothetical protein
MHENDRRQPDGTAATENTSSPPTDARVLRALSELDASDRYHSSWFAYRIAKHLNANTPAVTGRLRSLRRRGLITRASGGAKWLWGLPSATSAQHEDGVIGELRAHIAASCAGQWNGTLLELADNSVGVTLARDEHDHELWLEEIEVTRRGRKDGSRVIEAIGTFCQAHQIGLYVGPITFPSYWEGRYRWLELAPFDRHGCPVLQHRPTTRPANS